jgi:hypothetical protein
MCILDLALANFFFINRLCLSKNYKIHLLIVLAECIKKPSSAGAIKRTNSRKESLSTTTNAICIYMIYLRNNHLNLSILIQETNALYVACEAVVIITITKGAGEEEGVSEEEGAGEKVTALFISLSLSSLRLIRCTFNR